MAEWWSNLAAAKGIQPTPIKQPVKPTAASDWWKGLAAEKGIDYKASTAPKPQPIAPAPKPVEDRVEHADPTGPAGQDWARKIGNNIVRGLIATGGAMEKVSAQIPKFGRQMIESTGMAAHAGEKALGQTLSAVPRAADYAQRGARAASTVAATPLAWLMSGGKEDAAALAEQQTQTAKDILLGKESPDEGMKQAAQMYLKSVGPWDKRSLGEKASDIATLAGLGIVDLMGDPAYEAAGLSKLAKEADHVLRFKKVAQEIRGTHLAPEVLTLEGKTVKPRLTRVEGAAREVQINANQKVRLIPTEEGPVVIEGYQRRGTAGAAEAGAKKVPELKAGEPTVTKTVPNDPKLLGEGIKEVIGDTKPTHGPVPVKTAEIQVKPELFQLSRRGELRSGLLNAQGAEPMRVMGYLEKGLKPELIAKDPMKLGRMNFDDPEHGIKKGDVILISGHNRLEMLNKEGVPDVPPEMYNIKEYDDLGKAVKDSIKANTTDFKLTTYTHNVIDLYRNGLVDNSDLIDIVGGDVAKAEQIARIGNFAKQLPDSVWENALIKLSTLKQADEKMVSRKLAALDALAQAAERFPETMTDPNLLRKMNIQVSKIVRTADDTTMKTIEAQVERLSAAKTAEEVKQTDLFGQIKQKEEVKAVTAEGPKTIKEVAQETGILEPNVRRILGVGEKEGEFTRLAEGVYVLKTKDGNFAYIQAGDAMEVLPDLAKKGVKVNMVFLDIPYKTAAVKGGNRGVKYNLITVKDFKDKIVPSVKAMLKDDNATLVYMYSNAPSGWGQMMQYNKAIIESGLQIVAKGTYTKVTSTGKQRNFGKHLMQPEGILVFNKSGKPTEMPPTFDYKLVAPSVRTAYQTEKPKELIEAIIKGTTKIGDIVLDPFAGSGVVPAEALKAGRSAIAIEKRPEVVEERIKPRVEAAAKHPLVGKRFGTPEPVKKVEVPSTDLYRGGGKGSMPKGMTAQDIINYEQKELGNKDVVPEKGVDLSKVKSDNLVWLTEKKADAAKYGSVEKVSGNYRVIARDADGGVLVEKQTSPTKPVVPEPKHPLVGKRFGSPEPIKKEPARTIPPKEQKGGDVSRGTLASPAKLYPEQGMPDPYTLFADEMTPQGIKEANKIIRSKSAETVEQFEKKAADLKKVTLGNKVKFREGGTGRFAAGLYNPMKNEIKIGVPLFQIQHYSQVLGHELGHAIDFNLWKEIQREKGLGTKLDELKDYHTEAQRGGGSGLQRFFGTKEPIRAELEKLTAAVEGIRSIDIPKNEMNEFERRKLLRKDKPNGKPGDYRTLAGVDIRDYYKMDTELIARFMEAIIADPGLLDLAPTARKAFEGQIEKYEFIQEFIDAARGELRDFKPAITFMADLRQSFQKPLGPYIGKKAYDEEVVYRAMRAKVISDVDDLVKAKFKGVKDPAEKLFTAAEGILSNRGGKKEFGTKIRTEVPIITLKPGETNMVPGPGFNTNWTLSRKNLALWKELDEGGYSIVGLNEAGNAVMFEKWRVSPEEGKAAYDALSPEGKRVVDEYTADISEAKDEFNRELLKAHFKIESDIEGYVHHTGFDHPSGTFKIPALRNKKAAAMKHRFEAEGYTPDLMRAAIKSITDLHLAKEFNKFVSAQTALVAKPLGKHGEPDPGWIEVYGSEGKGFSIEAKRLLIPTAEGGTMLLKVGKRYQIPKVVYDRYALVNQSVNDMTTAARAVNAIQRYWQVNILTHPASVGTNFISGAIQYAGKVVVDFYMDLLSGHLTLPKTRADVLSMFTTVTPKGWKDSPTWIYGGKQSSQYEYYFAQQKKDPNKFLAALNRGVDVGGDTLLSSYTIVEDYWKKVAINAERMAKGEKPETIELPRVLKAVNDVVDLYAYDYQNVPNWLASAQRHPAGAVMKPFMRYPYKHMKMMTHLAGAIFDRNLPMKERLAKFLAFATIMGATSYYLYNKKRQEQAAIPEPIRGEPLDLPTPVSSSGRVPVGTDKEGNVIYLRVGKYPFFNSSEFLMDTAQGNVDDAKQVMMDMIGAIGPIARSTMAVAGYKTEFDKYKADSIIHAEDLASFIPFSRMAKDLASALDPYTRNPKTVAQVFGQYIPTTDEELRTALAGPPKITKVPLPPGVTVKAPSPFTKSGVSTKTTYDFAFRKNMKDEFIKFFTGINIRRVNKAVREQFLQRELENWFDRKVQEAKEMAK